MFAVVGSAVSAAETTVASEPMTTATMTRVSHAVFWTPEQVHGGEGHDRTDPERAGQVGAA